MAKGDDELQKNITDLLGKMLSSECVDAVMVPKQLPYGEGVVQSLISDSKELEGAQPLAFVMPINSGTLISDMTKVTPSEKKIAAVLKPCEIRAAVELVKLKQASFDNIIIVGVDCPGTYSVNDYKDIFSEGKLPMDDFIKNVKDGKDNKKLRSACKACEYPIPENVDITIGIYGSDYKIPIITADSEEGKDILKILEINPQKDNKKRQEAVSKLKQRRQKAWDELLESTQKEVGGLDNLHRKRA
jgi:formate dehydrogenase subunit beta